MNKEELQSQLDAKGIKYDRRWAVAKLKIALDDAEKAVVKAEDKLGLPELTPEAEERSQPESEPKVTTDVEKTIQALRENAQIAKEMVEAKKPKSIKEASNVYKKREINEGVEIYETNSGKFVRVYTLKVHGKEYKELAEKFLRGRIGKGMGISYGKPVSRIIRPISA